jgi:intracellular sulfur oxidation DsrE/DsrF family protein
VPIPNIPLIQELSKAGVQLALCRQSALEHMVDFKTIQPIVQVNDSAIVTLMVLDMRGYVRITE